MRRAILVLVFGSCVAEGEYIFYLLDNLLAVSL